MVITHAGRLKRKSTGGRYRQNRSKRKYEVGSKPTLTTIGPQRLKQHRTKGGGMKIRVLTTDVANVYDPKSKKYFKAQIKTVKENPADDHYVRRNIFSKGTIIETDKGLAKITSRPGQDGTVNAVLI